MKRVAVIVLDWNGADDTLSCLQALLDQDGVAFHVYLLINGSGDSHANRLTAAFEPNSRITIIRREDNLGFARGVNYVVAEHLSLNDYEFVALLNNDAVPQPGWLEQLVNAAVTEDAQLVSSCLINYSFPDQLDNAGHLFLNTGEVLPRGAGEPVADFQTPFEVAGAGGGACLISTTLIQEIGLFDEFFHTGYEDAEFGLRAMLHNVRIVYCPGARVLHHISRSIDRIRDRRYAVKLQVNIWYTYFKLMPAPVILANAPFLLIRVVGVLAAAAVSLRWRLFGVQADALGQAIALWPTIRAARRQARARRRLGSWAILRRQTFFAGIYWRYFRHYLLGGRKTVFER